MTVEVCNSAYHQLVYIAIENTPQLVKNTPNYLAPGGGGRGIVMPMSVCLSVCVFVRVFAKFQSVISQPFLNRSL